MITYFLLMMFFVCCQGFFSGMETGMVSVLRPRAEHAARQGDATLFVVLENTRFGGITVAKPGAEGVAFLDWWERKGAPCPWKR